MKYILCIYNKHFDITLRSNIFLFELNNYKKLFISKHIPVKVSLFNYLIEKLFIELKCFINIYKKKKKKKKKLK